MHINKDAPHTASFLLKLKSNVCNNEFESKDLQIRLNEFSLKVSISDENFMICILNILPMEYIILDRLEKHLNSSCDDEPSIEVMREKMNHRYGKNKKKNEETEEKEKTLAAYVWQYTVRCNKHGKYSH